MISNTDLNKLKNIVDYFKEVPYDVTRAELYNARELYLGFETGKPETYPLCYDQRVYRHYLATGKQGESIDESLARTIHDHGIHTAMEAFFQTHSNRLTVGIMGGHALLRTDGMFRSITLLSKRLTEQGFYMLSGGGPGAMEATHIGAWMAGRTIEETDDALLTLSAAPSFRDEGWLSTALHTRGQHPHTGFRRHCLYARKCRYDAGSVSGCRSEPLSVVRVLQSVDFPRARFLDKRDACLPAA